MTVGIVGVAGALLLGFALLYAALTVSLGRSVDAQATSIAREVAALITAGRLADPVPQYGAQFVQVLDRDGRVVGASVTADQLTPVVTPAEREQLIRGEVLTISGSRAALASELRVAGAVTEPASSGQLVVAALPTADLDRAGDLLRRLLLIAFPLFLGVMALIAWRVVGAALRPVDDLRRGASRIGASAGVLGTHPHTGGPVPDPERLPVPPTHDEIHALATTLNDMLDRLDAARATQRTFVTDAAHELRSPLASIRLQLDVAAHVGDGGSLPADLLPEVDRLTALVEDLLTLARAGDMPPAPAEAVPLASFLVEVSQRYAAARVSVRVSEVPVAEATAGEVTAGKVAGAPGGLTAYLPRGDLVRAVTNLVDNAVRHARSEVVLSARSVCDKSGGVSRVEIVVSDDGHGIPESDRERVFDRFARLDEARARDAGGSGLGLAIARELVRRAGGDIRLEDAVPGLRAVVSLPTKPVAR
jgi:signal transduction histidine kinase